MGLPSEGDRLGEEDAAVVPPIKDLGDTRFDHLPEDVSLIAGTGCSHQFIRDGPEVEQEVELVKCV